MGAAARVTLDLQRAHSLKLRSCFWISDSAVCLQRACRRQGLCRTRGNVRAGMLNRSTSVVATKGRRNGAVP